MALTKIGKEGVTGISNSSDATAITIDSSENVLVGKTSADSTIAGVIARPDGFTIATRDGGAAAQFRRLTSSGDIVLLYEDGVNVGSMGSNGGGVFLEGPNYGFRIRGTGDKIFPSSNGGGVLDNVVDWGTSDARWDDIFATNGTIQTSDANEKQQIATLTDAEITAAKAISQLFKTFKWNSSVTKNGDAARTHTGVIAQDVEAAMTAAGLDAGDYAFFISSTWWEADEAYTDDDGNAQTRTNTYDIQAEAPADAIERNRKGIRYPELLAFVGASTEQRLANIETRITALENA